MEGAAARATRAPLLFPELSDEDGSNSSGVGLTFRDSKSLPVHRWYPYVEGFSAPYIEQLITSHAGTGIVFDPFGGSGTVNLIASQRGAPSAFCEANPFMRFVAESKVNARHATSRDFEQFERGFHRLKKWALSLAFERAAKKQDLLAYQAAFDGRDFFDSKDIRELLAFKEEADRFNDFPASRDLLLLSIASVTVACSHMTRRADLRRRRPD